MKRGFVYGLFIFITIFSLTDMIFMREDFPFSAYAMYAASYAKIQKNKPRYITFKMTLINESGEEIPLNENLLRPFSKTVLLHTLNMSFEKKEILTKKLQEALKFIKHNGEINDPLIRIKGLKLYLPKEDQLTLIQEVSL